MTPVIAFATALTEHPDLSRYSFKYAWLEGVKKARLWFLDEVKDWRDHALWPAGRVFGAVGEYRWQSLPGGLLHAVILLDEEEPPPEFIGRELEIEPDRISEKIDDSYLPLILWGEWVNPDQEKDLEPERKTNPRGGPRFYAREIPKIQEYPLSEDDLKLIQADAANKPRKVSPCMVVRRYRHAVQGEFLRGVRFGVQQSKAQDEETD
jgi:hypothetical protein